MLLTIADEDLAKIELVEDYALVDIYKLYLRKRAQQLNKLYQQIATLKYYIKIEEDYKRLGRK